MLLVPDWNRHGVHARIANPYLLKLEESVFIKALRYTLLRDTYQLFLERGSSSEFVFC